MASLGSLEVGLKLNKTEFDASLKKAQEDLAGLSKFGQDLKFKVNIDFGDSEQVKSKLDSISQLYSKLESQFARELTIKVDDQALTDLNAHLSLKQTHYNEVRNLFSNNPLEVKVNDVSLSRLNTQLDLLGSKFKQLKSEFSNVIDVEYRVQEKITGANPTQKLLSGSNNTSKKFIPSNSELPPIEELNKLSKIDAAAQAKALQDWRKLGENLGDGLAGGIAKGNNNVSKASENLGKVAEQAVRKITETQSPSKVFERIGEDIARGLALGIQKGTGAIQFAVNKMFPNAQQQAKASVNTATTLSNAINKTNIVAPALTVSNGQSQGSGFMQGVLQGITSSFGGVSNALGPAALGALLAQPFAMAAQSITGMFTSIVTDAYSTAQNLERIKFKLEEITGSTAKANAELKSFKSFTSEYGGSASKMALASADLQLNSYGTSLANSRNADAVIKGFQTAFIAKRLSSEEQEKGFNYLDQIATSGTLSPDVLTKTLPKLLPGFLTSASRAYGVAPRQLIDLAKNQELDPYEFLQKVGNQLQIENQSGAKAAQGLSTVQLDKLQGHIKGLQSALGTQLVNAVTAAATAINKMFDAVDRHKDTFDKLGKIISSVSSVLLTMVAPVNGIVTGFLKFAFITTPLKVAKTLIDELYVGLQFINNAFKNLSNTFSNLFKGVTLPPAVLAVLKLFPQNSGLTTTPTTPTNTTPSIPTGTSSLGQLVNLQKDIERGNASTSIFKSLTDSNLAGTKLQIAQGLLAGTIGRSGASILNSQAEALAQGQLASAYQGQFNNIQGRLAGQFNTPEGQQALQYFSQFGLSSSALLGGRANVEGLISQIKEGNDPTKLKYLAYLNPAQGLYTARNNAMGAQTAQLQAQNQAEDALDTLQQQFKSLANSINDFGTELKKSLLESQNALSQAKDNLKADQFKLSYLSGKSAGTGSEFDDIFAIFETYQAKIRQINASQNKSEVDKLNIQQNQVKLTREGAELERQRVELMRNYGNQITATFANSAQNLTKIGDSVNSIVQTFANAANNLQNGAQNNPSSEEISSDVNPKGSIPYMPKGNAYRKAALDLIARTEVDSDVPGGGYNQLWTGKKFDWSKGFPYQYITAPIGGKMVTSSAAGRYQIMDYEYGVGKNGQGENWSKKLGLKGFSPAEQDYLAYVLAKQKANVDLDQPLTPEAIKRLSKIWVSMPGATAGQPVPYSMSNELAYYNRQVQKYMGNGNIQGLSTNKTTLGNLQLPPLPNVAKVNPSITQNQLATNAVEQKDYQIQKNIADLEARASIQQSIYSKLDEQEKLKQTISSDNVIKNALKLQEMTQGYQTLDQQRNSSIENALDSYRSYVEGLRNSAKEFQRKSETYQTQIEQFTKQLEQSGLSSATKAKIAEDLKLAKQNQELNKQAASVTGKMLQDATQGNVRQRIIGNATNSFNLDQQIAANQYLANFNAQYAAIQSRKTFDPFGSVDVASSIQKLKAEFAAQDKDLEINIRTKLNLDPNGAEANKLREQLQAIQSDQIEQAQIAGNKVAAGFSAGFADSITGLIDRSKTPLQALEGLFKSVLQPIAKNVGEYFSNMLTKSIFGIGLGDQQSGLVSTMNSVRNATGTGGVFGLGGLTSLLGNLAINGAQNLFGSQANNNQVLANAFNSNIKFSNSPQDMQAMSNAPNSSLMNFTGSLAAPLFNGLFSAIFNKGGLVPNFAGGGIIDLGQQAYQALLNERSQNGGITPVLAALTPGEYVVPRDRVSQMLTPRSASMQNYTNPFLGSVNIGAANNGHTINNNWNVAIHTGNPNGMSDSQVRTYNQLQTERSIKRFG